MQTIENQLDLKQGISESSNRQLSTIKTRQYKTELLIRSAYFYFILQDFTNAKERTLLMSLVHGMVGHTNQRHATNFIIKRQSRLCANVLLLTQHGIKYLCTYHMLLKEVLFYIPGY